MSEIPPVTQKPRSVDALDVESCPRGQRTRLLVRLVHDGLGHAVRVPVVVARGERTGPVFGVTAAVHGNELNGIPVIHRLLERLDLERLRGTIVAVPVVNVPGFLLHQREFNDGADLNLLFPGQPKGNQSRVYAHRFVERVTGSFEYLVDLHTASFGRINSLYVRANLTNKVTARMAYLQRPQIILHHTPSDYTLRGAAEERGIPAITVEIRDPQRFQAEGVRRALSGVRAVLSEVGMKPRRTKSPDPSPIICERSYWMYTDYGGLLQVFPEVADHVEEGEVVARLIDVFGDVIREYRAPEAGVVIGKSTNPVGQTGARILHLGIVAKDPSRFWS